MTYHPLLLSSQGAGHTVARCVYGHEGHGDTLTEAGSALADACAAADTTTDPHVWDVPMPAWGGDDTD